MLSHLIGKSFGAKPLEKLDPIREEKRIMAQLISEQLQLNGTQVVAELGSGTGLVAKHMAPRVKSLYCFDVSTSFLRQARQECEGLDNISYNPLYSSRLGTLPDASLDAIYALNVFIHLNLYDVYHYFHEFMRVVKPGGLVWFDIANADEMKYHFTPLFAQMAELYKKSPQEWPLLVQYLPPTAIAGIAHNCKFENLYAGQMDARADWCLFRRMNL